MCEEKRGQTTRDKDGVREETYCAIASVPCLAQIVVQEHANKDEQQDDERVQDDH